MTIERDELNQLEELVNQVVDVPPRLLQGDAHSLFGREPESLTEGETLLRKVDVLERALEQLRIQRRKLGNDVDYEDFVDGELFIDEGKIHFKWPDTRWGRRTGTPPMSLQPKLLTFLLLHHGTVSKVYDIIEGFVDKVWDSLDAMDFKRTKTGVVRCFTNTRFAALRLRDYGLLRFTQNEAYKTWTLSLPGFVAASKLVECRGWDISENYRREASAVHPDIVQALNAVSSYEALVAQLEKVCADSIDIFPTFKPVLEEAQKLLLSYKSSLEDTSTTKAEKREATEYYVKELDGLDGMTKFYKEFSARLNVQDLLKHFE